MRTLKQALADQRTRRRKEESEKAVREKQAATAFRRWAARNYDVDLREELISASEFDGLYQILIRLGEFTFMKSEGYYTIDQLSCDRVMVWWAITPEGSRRYNDLLDGLVFLVGRE